MKFNEIPADIFSLRMTQDQGGEATLEETPVLRIAQSVSSYGSYELYREGSLLMAKPVDARRAATMDRELSSGCSYLARITDIDAGGGFTLEVAFFSRLPLEIGEQDIGVDEYVVSRMQKVAGFNNREVNEVLQCEFCYQQGEDSYFFVLAGASIEDEINPLDFDALADDEMEMSSKNTPVEDDELPDTHKELSFSKEASFCVVSSNVSFVATEKNLSHGSSIYVATKLHKRQNKSDLAIRLAHGKLNFRDWTAAGQVQMLAKYQLADIVQDDSSYLKTWDKFGNIEGEILLRKAREIGVIYYHNAQDNRDGTVTITIADASNVALEELAARHVENLEYVDEIPSYIADPDMTFSDFSRLISKATWRKSEFYQIVGYDQSARQLTLDVEHMRDSGKLVLSLRGDITQIKRRNAARRAILEGRSANPQLGLLLEEKGIVESLRLPKKVKPLTAFVRNKVFKNDPTYMQEKAIEVALNTPDIALIQGPPGTGKTTVIAAIVERLNQESTKEGNEAKGQVLLTGFQHDAVENMIDRISLNSIPVPKIGKRPGQTEDDIGAFERSLNEWCERIVADIRAQYPDIDTPSSYHEIDTLAAQYAMAPTLALAATLTARLAKAAQTLGDVKLSSKAAKLAKKLAARNAVSNDADTAFARAVRLIRTSEAAFLDDGPDRADDALDCLYDMLEPRERDTLRKASAWSLPQGTPPFMDDLRRLKKALLMRVTAPPVFRVEKTNQEVIELLRMWRGAIEKASKSISDRRLAALSEFVTELECNSLSVMDAVSEYSFAFAATCQQSAGKKMQSLKGITADDDSSGLVYEYVIVDEAARVSPRDLMVPMAQGKRIILVGDHRQLPHIIDEEIAAQMEGEGADVNEVEWLKKSMFEYLFTERLKDLERQDGIRRRVTLDTQFRMHPALASFISRNFYERFDADEKLSSGLPVSVFVHNLPHTQNKPLAWLEVPRALGAHTRKGTSWVRQAEIDAIAGQLFEWMNAEEGKGLSFGVISFYKAQALAIEQELIKRGADTSRLRVGTVDSFQGMEFDVVFLSMVRTLSENYSGAMVSRTAAAQEPPVVRSGSVQPVQVDASAQEAPVKRRSLLASIRDALFSSTQQEERAQQEAAAGISAENAMASALKRSQEALQEQKHSAEERKQAQRLFGHLCLYNRLNVSMSRQKRLLVVAGDSNLLRAELAAAFIPGLVDFYESCQREGVILQWPR